ncbi:TolC family protein, partial [Candidatus Saganbacteria bacterium]|nr:TolC family protein [Candidatus Saganbacteria bacterium]
TALRQNHEIQSAKSEWEAAGAKVSRSLRLSDPKIGLEYEQIPKMFTAEQMVMFPGKIYAEYLMAAKEAEIYAARYRAKSLEITSRAKSAYYDLYLADRSIAIMDEVVGLLNKIKKSARAKYAVGSVMQMDVLQANIEYQLVNNELLTLRQEREVKAAKLTALLNRSDRSSIEVDPDFSLPAALESAEALEKIALRDRPELLAMKAEIEMKDASHLRSKMEFFPDTMLGVRKRVGDGWDAMFSFSAPLYFWKQSYGVSSAGLEREAAESAYNNMKNMTLWEVKEAYVTADAARRTYLLYRDKILPQSEQALKAALKAYQTGKTDFPALLLVERMYKEAGLKLYENQAGYGKAWAELERIIGKEVM